MHSNFTSGLVISFHTGVVQETIRQVGMAAGGCKPDVARPRLAKLRRGPPRSGVLGFSEIHEAIFASWRCLE